MQFLFACLLVTLTLAFQPQFVAASSNTVVAKKRISLENRHSNEFVNSVFKDNILLTLSYMRAEVNNPASIDWQKVQKSFSYQFSLKPNETFAFQEDVLSLYKDTVAKTTNAHFNMQEGFRHDGYLAGDGVCHLASIMYWVAKDASLHAYASANHDFTPIPEIPKEYGVSIYSNPGNPSTNALQNLYVTNNTENNVTFRFDYDGTILEISVLIDGYTQIINI